MTIKNQKSKIKNALTLVEMLAVIGIILILLVMLVPVTLKVQERDQVGQAASAVQSILTQAKNRALRENKNIGIRFRPRIRQSEIPAGVRGNLQDMDGDGVITFLDVNHRAANGNYVNHGTGRAPDPRDGNGNQLPVSPFYLFIFGGGYGGTGSWVTRNPPTQQIVTTGVPDDGDDDLSGFPDDIVVVDELELIEQPSDFRDGWVWAPHFTALGTQPFPVPAKENLSATPSEQLAGAPFWVPFAVPELDTYPADGRPDNNRLYGPFNTVWSDANSQTHQPLRAVDFQNSGERGEIQNGDLIEIQGLGQTYTIIGAWRHDLAPTLHYLHLDRPLSTEIPVPRNLQSNYRIMRQPRPIPGEPTVRLPAGIAINLNPMGDPSLAAGNRLRDSKKEVYVSGLCCGLSLHTTNIDIVFSPSGQVVSPSNVDVIHIWLVDTTAGNNDNQMLVTVYTRTGKIATFPVEQLGPDPYAHTRIGRAEGG